MKWYEPIECSNSVSNPLVTTEVFFGGIDPRVLRQGMTINNWDDSFWIRCMNQENDGEPDDVLQTHMHRLPVYSERLRGALERAGIGGIQYLPANVFGYGGRLIQGFAVGNILSVVPALDPIRSRYSRFGDDRPDRKGEIRGVRQAVLKRAILEGRHIFRLKEFTVFICVSERFKDAFEAGGFTGYSFKELETT